MSDPASPMPAAGAMPGDDAAAPADGASASTTLVTICKEADGSYVVYAGDKPDAAGAAPEGGGTGSAGSPADSVGAALKATLDILKADENGDEQGDFNAGYDGGSNASPAKPSAPAAMA